MANRAAPVQMRAQPKAPRFEDVSRRIVYPMIAQSRPAAGGRLRWYLPHSHYLSHIIMTVRGQIDITGGTPNPLGLSAMISEIKFSTNIMQDIFRVSGPGYHWLVRPSLDFVSDPIPQSNARSAIADGLVNLDVIIPLAPNQRDAIGLITLQSNEVEATLEVNCATDAEINPGGSIDHTTPLVFWPRLVMFTVPPYAASQPNTATIHKIIEDTRPIAATGYDTYLWPRANLYGQLIHGAGFAATGGKDKWDNCIVRVNRTNNQMDFDPTFLDAQVPFSRLAQRLPGTIPIDLQSYSGLGGYDKLREGIDSRMVTDIETAITFNDTGTFYSVRREFVTLTQPGR